MKQKCYSKQELALQYFPDATPEVASAHLRRWINRSKCPSQKMDQPLQASMSVADMTLFFWEYFCQLLCHALCEYGGINYLALWVDEIHGREP